jgi:hypothetical protein
MRAIPWERFFGNVPYVICPVVATVLSVLYLVDMFSERVFSNAFESFSGRLIIWST